MGALREGPIYDVTVEHRTRSVGGVDVPVVHARPDGPCIAGALHPDIGGLRPLFEDMARRLATHGFAVAVLEPFATVPASELTTIEDRMAHVKDLVDSQQLDVFDSCANLLVVEDDIARVSTLGFCMGGHYVFKAAAMDRFDAAVSFYGMLRRPEGWRGPGHTVEPLDVAEKMCPTLAFFGTADSLTPPEEVEMLREQWRNRTDCEIVIVEGAEHGFVHDPERPAHRPDDAANVWDKTLVWLAG